MGRKPTEWYKGQCEAKGIDHSSFSKQKHYIDALQKAERDAEGDGSASDADIADVGNTDNPGKAGDEEEEEEEEEEEVDHGDSRDTTRRGRGSHVSADEEGNKSSSSSDSSDDDDGEKATARRKAGAKAWREGYKDASRNDAGNCKDTFAFADPGARTREAEARDPLKVDTVVRNRYEAQLRSASFFESRGALASKSTSTTDLDWRCPCKKKGCCRVYWHRLVNGNWKCTIATGKRCIGEYDVEIRKQFGNSVYTIHMFCHLVAHLHDPGNRRKLKNKDMQQVLAPYIHNKLSDTFLSRLAQLVRDVSASTGDEKSVEWVYAVAAALENKGWGVDVETMDAGEMQKVVNTIAQTEHYYDQKEKKAKAKAAKKPFKATKFQKRNAPQVAATDDDGNPVAYLRRWALTSPYLPTVVQHTPLITASDFTHATTRDGGVFGVRVLQDAGGSILPLAITFNYGNEDKRAWAYMNGETLKALPEYDSDKYVDITDRCKGEPDAHNEVIPNTRSFYDPHHMRGNIKDMVNKSAADAYSGAVTAYPERKLRKLLRQFPKALEKYLRAIEQEKLYKCLCPGLRGRGTSNAAKSFNEMSRPVSIGGFGGDMSLLMSQVKICSP